MDNTYTIWINTLDQVKCYLDIKKEIPKNKLGEWLYIQMKLYEYHKMNPYFEKKWIEFLMNYEDFLPYLGNWNILFYNVCHFIKTYKRIPKQIYPISEEERYMAIWIKRQEYKYKNNRMNDTRKTKWIEFNKSREFFSTKKTL